MKRTLLSRSAFIFAIRFFPLAATTAAGIAFSQLLPPALNGIYARLWMVYTGVFATLACFGLAPMMLTHPVARVDEWLRHLRLRTMLVFLFWLLALAAVLTLFFLRQDAFQPWVAAPLLLAQVWMLLSESYLIIRERFVVTLSTGILFALGFAGAHILFLTGGCSLTELFLLIAALGATRAALLTLVGRHSFKRAAATKSGGAPMPPSARRQWMQLGIYDVSQMLFRWIDKLALSALIGPALFAVYLNGTLEVPFVATLLGAVGNSLLQQMAQGDQDNEARVRMMHLSGALLARIVFPLFFFLFFFRESFIVFVFSEKYLASVPLFGISICALLLRAYNYTSILQHLNRVKLINWGALLDLGLALLLSLMLYPWLGLAGVVLAFTLSSYVQAAFYLHHTARLLRKPVLSLIPWRQWLWMLVVFGGIIGGVHELLARNCSMKQALLLGFAATALLGLAALIPFLARRKSHG
jgi:O-antigen/teichoic acid export membrane protein